MAASICKARSSAHQRGTPRGWLAVGVAAALGSHAAAQEQLLSVNPLILAVPRFASAAECEEVLGLLERCHRGEIPECDQKKSRLKSKAQNLTNSSRKWRSSMSFTLQLEGELEPAVDALVRRAHILARHPVTHGEGVQVASYGPGDYYEFHHDSMQRRVTVLLYLNDVADGDGGETIFPLLRAEHARHGGREPPLPPAVTGHTREFGGFKVTRMEEMAAYCKSDFYLKVRPEAGKALIFYSYGPDRTFEEYAIHGSCKLRRGHKAIFQRWMRFDENTLIAKASDIVRDARIGWGKDAHLPIVSDADGGAMIGEEGSTGPPRSALPLVGAAARAAGLAPGKAVPPEL